MALTDEEKRKQRETLTQTSSASEFNRNIRQPLADKIARTAARADAAPRLDVIGAISREMDTTSRNASVSTFGEASTNEMRRNAGIIDASAIPKIAGGQQVSRPPTTTVPLAPVSALADSVNPLRQGLVTPPPAAPPVVAARPVVQPGANPLDPKGLLNPSAFIPRTPAQNGAWTPEQIAAREAVLAGESAGEGKNKSDWERITDEISATQRQKQLDAQADSRFEIAANNARSNMTKDLPFWEKNKINIPSRVAIENAATDAGRAALSGQSPREALDVFGAEKTRQTGDVAAAQVRSLDSASDIARKSLTTDLKLKTAQADNATAEASTRRAALTPEGLKAKAKGDWDGMPNDVKDFFVDQSGQPNLEQFAEFGNYHAALGSKTPLAALTDWQQAKKHRVPVEALTYLKANPGDRSKFIEQYGWAPNF